MRYIEVMLTKSEILPYWLGEIGFESFVEDGNKLLAYIQEKDFDEKKLKNMLDNPIFSEVEYSYKQAEDRDWNEEWEKENNKPFEFEDLKINIEARMAFGTGQHETTAMMVRNLRKCMTANRKSLTVDYRLRILDAGCGTGILSIAASMMGADDVWGYDIDEWSVENSKHNAELNGVGNCHFVHGDASVLGEEITGPFDIVLANINRNILTADVGRFVSVMNKNEKKSKLIVSGFYKEDTSIIIESFAKYNLHLIQEPITNNNWASLVFEN